jgi:2-polyprenyl-6-hydroxyphenyl methylase/3-demethylubiquinone-9 3-methyltransferase
MPDLRPPVLRRDALSEARNEYRWDAAGHAHNHRVLLPALEAILGAGENQHLIDLGCGNGSLTAALARQGFNTVGIDMAVSGIGHAQISHPELQFLEHDLGMPLPEPTRDRFDVAIATEVIEHLFLPRSLFQRADEALRPGGMFVITTPYHGWLKNVALSVTNKLDRHWSPGWDYGHIKFFSQATLTMMATECGFIVESFHRVGRVPPLAMSMILVAEKRTL